MVFKPAGFIGFQTVTDSSIRCRTRLDAERRGDPVILGLPHASIWDAPKSSRKESGLQELAAGIHGQIPCQEHSVADDTENRWKLGHRVPIGFGGVGSGTKNGCAGIRDARPTLTPHEGRG